MLAVLGGLADVERDLIRTCTAEGRSRAKAQGQQMGRPPALTPAQQTEATRCRAEGATLDELARSYGRVRKQHNKKVRSLLKPRLRRAFEGEAGSRRSGEGSSDLLGAAQEGLAGMADDLADGVEQQEA
jgi:DNA invertase Pin-like site-specific DNA recombinase